MNQTPIPISFILLKLPFIKRTIRPELSANALFNPVCDLALIDCIIWKEIDGVTADLLKRVN